MNATIKDKAQQLYPVEKRASEYTAFCQGATAVLLELAKILQAGEQDTTLSDGEVLDNVYKLVKE